jgi:two-component system, response regulator / RNA-binding antiterminator
MANPVNVPADKSVSGDSLRATLANLNITICAEPDAESDQLMRELQRTRAAVVRLWPIPKTLTAEPDVIFCDYAPDLAARLPWNPGEPRCALVILLPQSGLYDPSAVYNCSPGAVLYRPFQSHAILTALLLARGQFQYEKRLRARIERLDENLRLLRDIEQAKLILMEREKISEQDAYHRMRSLAMEKRMSLVQLASQIIDSAALLR